MDIPEYSPEMRLLLTSARIVLRPIDSERIVGLCRGQLNWQIFLNLVDRHCIAPLVWHSLRTVEKAPIPDFLLVELRQRVEKNVRYALLQTAELLQIAQRFERAGIPWLPLKGPVLAMQVYGTLSLRHAGDLDLLIDPNFVWDADRILAEAGYVRTIPAFELSAGQAAAFMKIRKDFEYIHTNHSIPLELHWRLTQNAYLFPVAIEEITHRGESVRIGGGHLAGMASEDLLLYLCAHGAHTGWFRLKWLCDIQELLGNDSRINMSTLLARAQHLGLSRMLTQGFLLVSRIFDAPLPHGTPAMAKQDRIVKTLVKVAERALVKDEHYWTTNAPFSWMPAQLHYRLNLCANLKYKLHNLYFYSLWTEEWRLIRIPVSLFPLYFVLRPLLWLGCQLRNVNKRLWKKK